RVCRVDVSLLYSTDGGNTFPGQASGGGFPSTFPASPQIPCANPGVSTTSLTYTLPTAPPSVLAGSLYKVRVVVTDEAGNVTPAESANPFYIVQANPDSVRTVILSNLV